MVTGAELERMSDEERRDVVPHAAVFARVSPEHALIWRHQDAIVLHVTDHSAACLVNERPMTWATLEAGDEVRMGTFRMHIEVNGADS